MDRRHAFHLRCETDPESRVVDAWLERHGYRTTPSADAYEAVVALLGCGDATPSIAFVRADQLSRDDYEILRFLRETAPEAPLIVYGRTIEGPLPDAAQEAYVCATSGDLTKLLDLNPADMPRTVRAAGETPPATEAAAVDASALEPDCAAADAPETQQSHARPLLTSEELAALFGDDPVGDSSANS